MNLQQITKATLRLKSGGISYRSREERSRNDAPDYAFMHIHNRSDAGADRCFGMLTWNAIRYHRKKIGFSYGYLI